MRLKHFCPNSGFTLIELLVVVSIMLVMSMLIFANMSSVNGSTALDLLAQQIAVYIREAQVYGGAEKQAAVNTYTSYGIHFDSTKTQFVLWADKNGDNQYNAGTEDISLYSLPANFEFAGNFSPSSGGSSSQVDIFYKKPDPEAIISCHPTDCGNPSSVSIIIRSTRNHNQTRTIKVYNNGQIAVTY